MGHLVNPISFRLSINSFWTSSWTTINRLNYNNLFKKDYILFHFLNWFINKSKFLQFEMLLSHYKIYRINNLIFINFYYYVSKSEKYKSFYYNSVLQLLFKKKKIWKNKKFWKNKKRQYTRFPILYKFKNSVKIKKWFIIIPKVKKRKLILKKNFDQKKKKSKFFLLKLKIIQIYKYLLKSIVFNLYWLLINYFFIVYLKNINYLKSSYYINVYNISLVSMTPNIITKYIYWKLQKRFSLNWTIRPIIKDLANKVKQKIFLGFKIMCAGRFTRKQIATYVWKRGGSVKLNTISSLIKYSESVVRLKYGMCGIKLWINYGYNNLSLLKRELFLTYPIFIPFKYKLSLKFNSIFIYFNYWYYIYLKIVFFKLKFFLKYIYYIKIKLNLLFFALLKVFFKLKYKIIVLPNNIIKINFIKPRLNYFKSIKVYE